MNTREKKRHDICGDHVSKLKQHIQSKHQSVAEEVINTMILKQKKIKCQVEGQATVYVKCAMSINDRECGKMIKEAE